MMSRAMQWGWLLALLSLCGGCATQADYENALAPSDSVSRRMEDVAAPAAAESEASASGAAGFLSGQVRKSGSVEGDSNGEDASPNPRPEANRMRIYRASVDLLVGSVNDALKSFVSVVEQDGGYLESRDNGSVTVRVPAPRFWATLDTLKALGTVISESQSTEDVTRQYQDLELRIQTAETSRTRLLALLEKATDTKALLEIENEVRRLTEEIETMRGHLKNLAQLVAYSTIRANFRAAVPEVPRPRPSANRFPWLDRVGPEPMLRGF